MLRPATPLTVLYFVAFVLLLLSTLSTPVIKAIPLASYGGINYGVFGACSATECTKIQIGYSLDHLFNKNEEGDFSLSSNTRQDLSAILIVHPVAAFLTLICFGLAAAAHFHSPAHSPRYLLALLILSFPTLLVSLLAFLVDILLFVPHLAWGGWIVLAATILIVASGVVTCAMRRTLVSRKARKKRIAENAAMNGTEYYQSRDLQSMTVATTAPPVLADPLKEPYARAESPPPLDEETKFAQYSSSDANGDSPKDNDTDPLNRPGSLRGNGATRSPPMQLRDQYGNPVPSNGPMRDQYGNIVPPNAIAAAEGLPAPGMRRVGSRGSINSQGSGRSYRSNGSRGPPGPPPPGYAPRGRGGMGPQRGGYGPPRGGYGPPRGGFGPPRGNYYGPPRGGMGPGRGPPPGMRGPPPPGWNAPPNGRSSPYGGPMRDPYRESPPPRNGDDYVGGPSMGDYRSHGPVGQAVEMNDRPGSAAGSYVPARAGWSDQPHSPTEPQRYQQPPGSPPFHLQSPPANAAAPDHVYEDGTMIPDGARSPTGSDASNFTSVSQRGINPQWRPPPGPTLQPPPNNMKQQRQRREDIVLNTNPDFSLPNTRPGRGGRGGSRHGSASGILPPASMLPDGRYPPAA